MHCTYIIQYCAIGLWRRVDIVDVIDYVNTSTCIKCVDASQINNMAAPSESMEAPGEEPAAKKTLPTFV